MDGQNWGALFHCKSPTLRIDALGHIGLTHSWEHPDSSVENSPRNNNKQQRQYSKQSDVLCLLCMTNAWPHLQEQWKAWRVIEVLYVKHNFTTVFTAKTCSSWARNVSRIGKSLFICFREREQIHLLNIWFFHQSLLSGYEVNEMAANLRKLSNSRCSKWQICSKCSKVWGNKWARSFYFRKISPK